MLEKGRVEIDDQANVQSGTAQVRNYLVSVNGLHSWYRFDLHDDDVRHDQIDPLTWDLPLFVANIDLPLALERNPPQLELEAQRTFIDPFAKAWAQMPVHLDGTPDRGCDNRLVLIRKPADISQHSFLLRDLRELRALRG
jgi:hypothetical protein